MTDPASSDRPLRLAFSIDSSKVTAAAFSSLDTGEAIETIKLHGFAKSDTKIVAPAGPLSLRQASDVILELTEAIETQTGSHFSDAAITFASGTLQLGGSSVRVPVRGEKIGNHDTSSIERLWKGHGGTTAFGTDNHSYLHIRTPYRVDRHTLTPEPDGLVAGFLAQTETTFQDRRATLLNWIEAFRMCGLGVRRFLPQPLASLYAAASVHERKQGIMVVDIGHSMTQIIVCRDSLVRGCHIHNIGSDRITEDLSICLKTDPQRAESLKRSAMHIGAGRRPSDNGLAPEIIAARASEIARLVKTAADRIFSPRDFVAGVVLVGGGAKLTGLAHEFRLQVHPLCRVASSFGVLGLNELLDDPGLASLAGCLIIEGNVSKHLLDGLPLDNSGTQLGAFSRFARLFRLRP
jgi:cell division protein FtsA